MAIALRSNWSRDRRAQGAKQAWMQCLRWCMLAWLVCLGLAAQAQTPTKNILLLGDDSNWSSGSTGSAPYFNAALRQLQALPNVNVVKIGGLAKYDNAPASAQPPAYQLQPKDLRMADGSKYDVVVLLAVYNGISLANQAVIKQAILQRDAQAFFLFPDQCSRCEKNVDEISVNWINEVTHWGISKGDSIRPSSNDAKYLDLNTQSPYKDAFEALPTLRVQDFTSLNGVPKDFVLYMPKVRPLADNLQPNGTVNNVGALVVPRATFGQNACVFVISDAEPWYLSNQSTPPNPGLAQALLDASAGQTCSGGEEGHIDIVKTLSLPAGQAGPIGAQFFATCDKPVADQVYSSATTQLVNGVNHIAISNIPAGAQCVISEQVDPAPAGYAWSQSLPSAPVTIVAGQQVAVPVANTLKAIPPSVGVIRVVKTLALGGHIAETRMRFTASCKLASGSKLYTSPEMVMQLDGSQSTEIADIPAGAECTVAEAMSNPPTGFTWQQTLPSGAVKVVAGQTVEVNVSNALVALPANTGLIRVNKILQVPSDFVDPVALQFFAQCALLDGSQARYPSRSFTLLGSGQQAVDIADIPVGAQCTVSEELPPAPDGYSWTKTEPTDRVTVVAGKPAQTTITNVLQALPPRTGVIRVHKTLQVPDAVQDVFALQFAAQCVLADGSAQQYTSAAIHMQGSSEQTVEMANIPLAAQCQISESLPAAPAGYSWQQTLPDAAITVADTPATAEVRNVLQADPVVATPPNPVPGLRVWAVLALSMLVLGSAVCAQRRHARSCRDAGGPGQP